MKKSCLFIFLGTIFVLSNFAWGVSPTAEELKKSKAWFENTFTLPENETREPGVWVIKNHGPVQKNARAGKALRIDGKEFKTGLFCHAPSEMEVQLPSGAKSFHAVIGVDSNEQTKPGRGSVVFGVRGDGKELFRSKLMREGMPGEEVSVDLGGAQRITLYITDGGDNIHFDQADWAEARIELNNGKVLGLFDLPIFEVPCHKLPFSFEYGGTLSHCFLSSWKRSESVKHLDENRTQKTIVWTDPETGLNVECVAVLYNDFPVVEWHLQFHNNGTNDTPILSAIRSMDLSFSPATAGEFILHHNQGDVSFNRNCFHPYQTVLASGAVKKLGPVGGRGTFRGWPYFNVERAGEGLIAALGWPGQWQAAFTNKDNRTIQMQGGQETTYFSLKPGETAITPSVTLLFWEGDQPRSQNVWRRWFLKHITPRPNGQEPAPIFAVCGVLSDEELATFNEKEQLEQLKEFIAEGIKPDYWWIDAGWYTLDGGNYWGDGRGNWTFDKTRFPDGIKNLVDFAHKNNIKQILWFEPETVCENTALWKEGKDKNWLTQGCLLDLGNPDARAWITDRIDKIIEENGVDFYRQDFNMDPLPLWQANDTPTRKGMTENRHIAGYLAFWDALLQHNPGIRIDSCASGGRRNDMESARRSIPLLRSDYRLESIGNQGMTYGLAPWLPLYGSPTCFKESQGWGEVQRGTVFPISDHNFWSCATPCLAFCVDIRNKKLDFNAVRRLHQQWESIADCYLGDFWPLTPYSVEDNRWIAWQFDVPEKKKGMVQAFRRKDCTMTEGRFALRGLDPTATYCVTRLTKTGDEVVITTTGKELLEKGLRIAIDNQPGAAVFRYKQK